MSTTMLRKKDTGETVAAGGSPGQFGSHQREAAEPPATTGLGGMISATVRLQRWDANDYLVEVDSIELDVSEYFDDVELGDVPDHTYPGDNDAIFYWAQSQGMVDHDGPFDVEVDNDELEEYKQHRENTGAVDRAVLNSETVSVRRAAAAERVDTIGQKIAELKRQMLYMQMESGILEPVTFDSLVRMDRDGEVQEYARTLHTHYILAFQRSEQLRSQMSREQQDAAKMGTVDTIDFILRVEEDDAVRAPEFVDGTDDRVPHYLNRAIKLVNARTDGEVTDALLG